MSDWWVNIFAFEETIRLNVDGYIVPSTVLTRGWMICYSWKLPLSLQKKEKEEEVKKESVASEACRGLEFRFWGFINREEGRFIPPLFRFRGNAGRSITRISVPLPLQGEKIQHPILFNAQAMEHRFRFHPRDKIFPRYRVKYKEWDLLVAKTLMSPVVTRILSLSLFSYGSVLCLLWNKRDSWKEFSISKLNKIAPPRSNILFLVFSLKRIHRENEKTNILKKSKYIPSSYSAGTESPTILLGIGLLFSTLSPIRCSMAFHHPRLYRSGWPEPCTRPVWAGPNRAEKLITIRSLDGEEPSWKKKYLISIPPPNRGNLIDEISIGANFKQFIWEASFHNKPSTRVNFISSFKI